MKNNKKEAVQPEFPEFGKEEVKEPEAEVKIYERDPGCPVCGGAIGGCNQCGYTGKRRGF